MPTSCNTHDYDGKLREKWFQMRPILIEKYLPNCLSFNDTIQQIEQWLDKKYYNIKRIGRARRSLKILTSQRQSNFDSKNDIDVEELLPILWDQVKNQDDIHNTFYEQLCDITGGSCSQGRSTRLFQFLFLFDLSINTEEEKNNNLSTQQQSKTTTDENHQSITKQQDELKPHDQQVSKEEHQLSTEEKPEEEQHQPSVEEKREQSQTEHESNQVEQTNSCSTE